MRSHYWTCSKFANWLRGTKKPASATFHGWDLFEASASASHPFRYWLATTLLDKLQDIVFYIPDKWDDLCCYCRNRFIQRVHLIDTKLPPGQWMDTDTRLLHGVMEALVFYVEVDCAAWTKEKMTEGEKGLKHLDWEIDLVHEEWVADELIGMPTDQALAAAAVKRLYIWWTVIRPARVDPYDFVDEESEGLERYKLCTTIENFFEAEDEEMMMNVIRYRRGMWT